MRTALLSYLRCPECEGDLNCHVSSSRGDEIVGGGLVLLWGGFLVWVGFAIVRGLVPAADIPPPTVGADA